MVQCFNHVGLFLVLDGESHGQNIVPMSVIALHRCLLRSVFVCSLSLQVQRRFDDIRRTVAQCDPQNRPVPPTLQEP